jgi:hypothetical protein
MQNDIVDHHIDFVVYDQMIMHVCQLIGNKNWLHFS